jgi:hypothetical protein
VRQVVRTLSLTFNTNAQMDGGCLSGLVLMIVEVHKARLSSVTKGRSSLPMQRNLTLHMHMHMRHTTKHAVYMRSTCAAQTKSLTNNNI